MLGSPLGSSAIALVLVAVLSVPHARQLATNRRDKQLENYQAINSNAEEEIEYSKAPGAKWQRIVLTVTALVAGSASTPLHNRNEPWRIVQFVSWILLVLQEVMIASTCRPQVRYRLGCYSAVACLVLAITTVLINIVSWGDKYPDRVGLNLVPPAIQVSAGIILILVNLLLPRGPVAYRDGKLVDKAKSVSFLNKYSFTWARETLSIAAKEGRLNADDLPLIGDQNRAQTLYGRFSGVNATWRLWRKCFKIYRSTLTFQVILQLFSSSCHFLPQVFLFTLLRQFEARDAGVSNQFQLWLTAAGLGCSLAIASWFSSLVTWVADMKLALPVHEQLFAVITSKIVHLPDVVAPPLEGDNKSDSSSAGDENEDKEDDDAPDESPRTRHSILNLLGVDVDSISEFAGFSYLMLDCILEFIIAIIFLVNIMGWKPTLAGCTVPLLLTPIYYYLNKKYTQSEETLMEHRDKKSSVLSEAINGIRQIKFSALEKEWHRKILKLRETELGHQRTVYILDMCLIGIWSFGPIIMSIVSLSSYIYINNTISASVAFTAFSIFEGVEATLAILPEMVSDLLDASVSARRIERFLSLPERHDDRLSEDAIRFKNATITWPSDSSSEQESQFQLSGLQFVVPPGELTAVYGRSGAGKSLLLQAIIGEAEICGGTLSVPTTLSGSDRPINDQAWVVDGTMAYVSQDPWIENATVRNCILFGTPFNPERYAQVLHACALKDDLKSFSDGDKTEVGANGINLSGGQKWRISLARALYSRASILVMDDIFSAVDAHVGRHLFEHALTGPLCEGRTRILATHHLRLCLSKTAYCVVLDKGRVLDSGTPETLVGNGALDAVLQDETSDTEAPRPDARNTESVKSAVQPTTSTRRMSTSSFRSLEPVQSRTDAHGSNLGKFYEEEKRETGAVKPKIFKAYIMACGGYIHWILIFFLFALTLVDNLAVPYWVSIWTRSYQAADSMPPVTLQTDPNMIQIAGSGMHFDKRLVFYVSIYVALSLSAWLLEFVRYYLVFKGSLRASKRLFEQFTDSILKAPLSFLDITPAGRILNRFTADFNIVDSYLAMNLGWLLHSSVLVLAVIFAALLSSPFIVGFGLLSILASWAVASFYVTGAREAKRLESTARSPIFDQVSSLLSGLPTIRASNKEEEYLSRVYKLIDTHCQARWHHLLFSCWMSFWLSMVGAGFVTTVAVMFVSLRKLDAPLAGFALSFALDMSENISWLLSQYTRVMINFNAAERIMEYTELEPEPQAGTDVPAAWPTKGEIEVIDLDVRYSESLPPVLKGLTFSVQPNERVGIVGRTGAGKSSLTLAFLRFLEAQSGSICIDGFDIAKMRLHDLRSRVGIIPQDPVVFTGTVREVLDPFDQYDERELLAALEKVSLAPVGSQTDDDSGAKDIFSLSYPIAEGGRNLSQGQRQLLCLARAIVSQPKILIMDEATASVDMESDLRIQRSIREIHGCTLLVIAHRLSTIADFDRILVLSEGKVVEFDRPAALMQIEDGIFRGLVEQSGDRSAIEAMISAAG